MLKKVVVEPRLFFLSRNCADCPKAVFEFGDDEDDLGDWKRTSLKLLENDHAVRNGVEYVYRDGKLRQLGPSDDVLWYGESVPDEVFLLEVEHFVTSPPARLLDLLDKRGNFPLEAIL